MAAPSGLHTPSRGINGRGQQKHVNMPFSFRPSAMRRAAQVRLALLALALCGNAFVGHAPRSRAAPRTGRQGIFEVRGCG